MQELTKVSHKFAEEIYKTAGKTTAESGKEGPQEEKVVDAEFEEVDKDKK